MDGICSECVVNSIPYWLDHPELKFKRIDVNDFTRKLNNFPIENSRCAAKPFGCGKFVDPATEFTDELSRKEYNISGLCQACQDSVFNEPDREELWDDVEEWERNQLAQDND